jgi:hypothetical protein
MNLDNTPGQDSTLLPPATSAGAAAIGCDRGTPRRRWGLMPPFVPGAEPAKPPDAPESPRVARPAVDAEPWADAHETAETDAGRERPWAEPPEAAEPKTGVPAPAEPWATVEPSAEPEAPRHAEPWAAMEPLVEPDTRDDTEPWAAAGLDDGEPHAAADPWAAPQSVEPHTAPDPWAAPEPAQPPAEPDPWTGTAASAAASDAPWSGPDRAADALDESPWGTASLAPSDEWEPWLASPAPEPHTDATPASAQPGDMHAEEPAPDAGASAGQVLIDAGEEPWAAPAGGAEPRTAQVEAEPWMAADAPASAAEDFTPSVFPSLPNEDATGVTDAGLQDPAIDGGGGPVSAPFGSLPDSFFADAFLPPGAMQPTDAADEQHAERIMAERVAERLDDLSRMIRENGLGALGGSLHPDQLSRVLAAVVAGYVAGHD